MSWNQFPANWRESLVAKLQDRYELSETEANSKVAAWLDWLPTRSTLTAGPSAPRELQAGRSLSRRRSRVRAGSSKSRSAASE
jgi:hypothetical protein